MSDAIEIAHGPFGRVALLDMDRGLVSGCADRELFLIQGEQSIRPSVERVEDAALLSGGGRFIDDLGTRPGTLHAAIVRSPHAHAELLGIDKTAALTLPGVVAVITGGDLVDITTGLVPALRVSVDARAIAVDRVRYVGEPVAIVLATDRYRAEDGADLVTVRYRGRPAVIDPEAALGPDAPVLHGDVGSNLMSDRRFAYGDPDGAFSTALHSLAVTVRYPATPARRLSATGSWPKMIPTRMPTTSSPTSRGHSAYTPSWSVPSRCPVTACACAPRPTAAAVLASSRASPPMRC